MTDTSSHMQSPIQYDEPDSSAFSSGQTSAAAFFGGPIAASWLMYRNFQVAGRPKNPREPLIVGSAAMFLLVLATMLLPTDFPNAIIPTITVALAAYWFRLSFSKEYESHTSGGGRKASSWRVAKVCAVSFVVSLLTLVLFAIYAPIRPINSVQFDSNTIYFESSAKKEDAQLLGQYMTAYGFFFEESYHEITIKLTGSDAKFVVIEALIDPQPEGSEGYEYLNELAQALRFKFDGKKFEFRVVGMLGQALQTFPARSAT